MNAFGNTRALAIGAALVLAGSAYAVAVATADGGEVSTRHTYVVGGEVVHPPRPYFDEALFAPPVASPESTRRGYVVGGELVGLGR